MLKKHKNAKYYLIAAALLMSICHLHLEYYPTQFGINEKNIESIVSQLNELNYVDGHYEYSGKNAGVQIDKWKTDNWNLQNEIKAIEDSYISALFKDIYPKLISSVSYDNAECVFSPVTAYRYESGVSFTGIYEAEIEIYSEGYEYYIYYSCGSYSLITTPHITPLKDLLV